MTDTIYSTDAYARSMEAAVVGVDTDDGRLLLDRTVFYPGGGGQPHDVGNLWVGEDRLAVVRVTADRDGVWHWVEGGLPALGTTLRGELDWERRYKTMRTHTAMHAMCGVIWRRYQVPVTGGNMTAGEGRLDFELPEWDADDKPIVEAELNEELAARRAVEVSFLPRDEADQDPSLIRTKISLLPADLAEVRVIDIVGLDRQADGGTHVDSTGEVGSISLATVKSKGRGFRRFRFTLDA
ncbi:MAG: alanyl-tRNA editing protein [Acidimicrobiia bacterium]|nr:alanyl-tRNA editing protein [Acidimicrobiia bacterium]